MALRKQRKKANSRTYTILNAPSGRNSKFDYSEPYRQIRTSIEFSTVDKEIKSVCITSSTPSEGKSTTAVNLAIIFATKYKKVLLIDCDLRKSVIHRYLNLSNKEGLTNALMHYGKTNVLGSGYIQTVSHSSFAGALSVLTAGSKVPNPSELLGSDTFEKMIHHLELQYDFIILDCPPVLSVSDAIPVSNVVDGAVFVCSSKDTDRKDALACVNILKQNNVHVLGSILTRVDIDNKHYGYYY